MQIEPDELAHVTLDTFEPNSSTPSVGDPRWRGIVIRAATRVSFDPGERPIVPVLGYAMLDVPPQPIGEPMMLHVLTPDGEEVVGAIVPQEDHPDKPPPDDEPFDPSELEGVAAAAYFNCDLVDVCRLSNVVGPLKVWAQLGAVRSNDADVLIEST